MLRTSKSTAQVKMQLILQSYCSLVKNSPVEERQRRRELGKKPVPRRGEPSVEMELAA